MLTVKYSGVMPLSKSPEDIGYDLFDMQQCGKGSSTRLILPHMISKIPTGLYLEMPPNVWAMVATRSSSAMLGLTVLGGIIDPGYRGEIFVIMLNANDYQVRVPIKCAQLIFFNVARVALEMGEIELNTARGDKGFGSTGDVVLK